MAVCLPVDLRKEACCVILLFRNFIYRFDFSISFQLLRKRESYDGRQVLHHHQKRSVFSYCWRVRFERLRSPDLLSKYLLQQCNKHYSLELMPYIYNGPIRCATLPWHETKHEWHTRDTMSSILGRQKRFVAGISWFCVIYKLHRIAVEIPHGR